MNIKINLNSLKWTSLKTIAALLFTILFAQEASAVGSSSRRRLAIDAELSSGRSRETRNSSTQEIRAHRRRPHHTQSSIATAMAEVFTYLFSTEVPVAEGVPTTTGEIGQAPIAAAEAIPLADPVRIEAINTAPFRSNQENSSGSIESTGRSGGVSGSAR